MKSGDTLPLLSKAMYGSSQYYLRVAQINNLDDFRNLTPGQAIIFPPLEKECARNGAMSVVTATILSSGKRIDPTYEILSIDITKEANRIPMRRSC